MGIALAFCCGADAQSTPEGTSCGIGLVSYKRGAEFEPGGLTLKGFARQNISVVAVYQFVLMRRRGGWALTGPEDIDAATRMTANRELS
jgi:hypothetical protein